MLQREGIVEKFTSLTSCLEAPSLPFQGLPLRSAGPQAEEVANPMTLRVSGKNLDIGPALRERAQTEILQAVSKYFDGDYTGHLTVEKEGTGFQTECTLYLASGRTVAVTGSAHDAYACLTLVVERIAKQLRRYKREKKTRLHGAASMAEILPADGYLPRGNGASPKPNGMSTAAPDCASAIVAERLDNLPRHHITAAADFMEHCNLQSFVFRNQGTGRVNILRQREDGSIGWIDVPAEAQRV